MPTAKRHKRHHEDHTDLPQPPVSGEAGPSEKGETTTEPAPMDEPQAGPSVVYHPDVVERARRRLVFDRRPLRSGLSDSSSPDPDSDDSLRDEDYRPPSKGESSSSSSPSSIIIDDNQLSFQLQTTTEGKTKAPKPEPPASGRAEQPATKKSVRPSLVRKSGTVFLSSSVDRVKAKNAGRPRTMVPRRGQPVGVAREFKKCPIDGCGEYKVYIKKHLQHCHRELTIPAIEHLMSVMPRHRKRLPRPADDQLPMDDDQLPVEDEPTAEVSEQPEQSEQPPKKKKRKPRRMQCTECYTVLSSRLGLHLRRTHGLHTGSPEYKRLMQSSKVLPPERPKIEFNDPSMELDALMADFVRYLTGMSGGLTKPRAAAQSANNVRRIIQDIMGDDSWHPSILRRLRRIGEQPDGVLIRMQQSGYRASSVNVYVISLLSFIRYLQSSPEKLVGFCRKTDLPEYTTYLKGLQKSLSRTRRQEDIARTATNPESRGVDISLLGPFATSAVVAGVFRELQDLQTAGKASRAQIQEFVRCRNVLMAYLSILNGRRAGDMVNATVQEFTTAKKNSDEPDANHIMWVVHHKTASSLRCPVVLHPEIYAALQRYVVVFKDNFLRSGFLFPHVSKKDFCDKGRHMTESQFNVGLNHAWSEYVSERNDDRLPASISTRFIRHSLTTTAHKVGDTDAMQDIALSMAYSLPTARRYYDESRAATVMDRAARRIRQLALGEQEPPMPDVELPSQPSTSTGPTDRGDHRRSPCPDVEPSSASVSPRPTSPAVVTEAPQPTATQPIRTAPRRTKRVRRPFYSPGHLFVDDSWTFTAEETEKINAAMAPFYDKVLRLFNSQGQRTTIQNEGCLAYIINRGGEHANFAKSIRDRPGAAKKIGDFRTGEAP